MSTINDSELNAVNGGALVEGQRYIRYTVVKGDTLSGLSTTYRTTIEDIMALNPIIKKRNLIVIGWVLIIPDNRR